MSFGLTTKGTHKPFPWNHPIFYFKVATYQNDEPKVLVKKALRIDLFNLKLIDLNFHYDVLPCR